MEKEETTLLNRCYAFIVKYRCADVKKFFYQLVTRIGEKDEYESRIIVREKLWEFYIIIKKVRDSFKYYADYV